MFFFLSFYKPSLVFKCNAGQIEMHHIVYIYVYFFEEHFITFIEFLIVLMLIILAFDSFKEKIYYWIY